MAELAKLLSHEDLGISFPEWGALMAVRAMIECGALSYMDLDIVFHEASKWEQVQDHRINMNTSAMMNDRCGTIGCIGGNMAIIMGHPDPDDYISNSTGELMNLFYPNDDMGYEVASNKITTTQMLAAIDSYLTTGKPNWEAALKV